MLKLQHCRIAITTLALIAASTTFGFGQPFTVGASIAVGSSPVRVVATPNGAEVYVTVEPCAMCAGALIQARVARLIYGCAEPKGGAVRSCFQVLDHPAVNHRVEVASGVLADECARELQTFFELRR